MAQEQTPQEQKEGHIDRLEDFRSMIEISRFAGDHWSPEIVKQISYTIRRMQSEIKSSEGSSRVPTTPPKRGEQ